MTQPEAPPRLAAPGAGVTALERFVGGKLLLPFWCRRLSWSAAPEYLAEQGQWLIERTTELPEELQRRRVLVPRLIGLEDSSRFYSMVMLLEHLTIVGERVATVVSELTQGRVPPGSIGTAELKPSGEWDGVRAVAEYREMLRRFGAGIEPPAPGGAPGPRYAHPWFGPLGAYQWLCFAPFHQTIHLRQARRILRRIGH